MRFFFFRRRFMAAAAFAAFRSDFADAFLPLMISAFRFQPDGFRLMRFHRC